MGKRSSVQTLTTTVLLKKKKSRGFFARLKAAFCCCSCKAAVEDDDAEEYVFALDLRENREEEAACASSLIGGDASLQSSVQGGSWISVALSSPEQSSKEDFVSASGDLQTSSEEDFLSASEGSSVKDTESLTEGSEEASVNETESPSVANTEFVPEGSEEASVNETESPSVANTEFVHESSEESSVKDDELPHEKCEEPSPNECSAEQIHCNAEEMPEKKGDGGESVSKKKKRKNKKLLEKVQEEKDDGWHEVNKKKKLKKTKKVLPEKEPEAIQPSSSQTANQQVKAPRRRKVVAPPDDFRATVRQSWKEETVQVLLPVLPSRRRHVIGMRGETIKQLRQQYPAVSVSVPLPQDLESRHVVVEGPKTQVGVVAQEITARLETVEAQLREARERRQMKNTKVLLDVAPDMRRHVVGPGGETLRKIAQEYPSVRVTVPPAGDAQAQSVIIRGPRDEVSVVESCIKTRLQAVERQRQFRRERRATNRPPVAAGPAKPSLHTKQSQHASQCKN